MQTPRRWPPQAQRRHGRHAHRHAERREHCREPIDKRARERGLRQDVVCFKNPAVRERQCEHGGGSRRGTRQCERAVRAARGLTRAVCEAGLQYAQPEEDARRGEPGGGRVGTLNPQSGSGGSNASSTQNLKCGQHWSELAWICRAPRGDVSPQAASMRGRRPYEAESAAHMGFATRFPSAIATWVGSKHASGDRTRIKFPARAHGGRCAH